MSYHRRFRNLPNYAKWLECTICLEKFSKPSVTNCGHCFCRNCAVNLSKCPNCRSNIEFIKEDPLIQGLIDELEVVCNKEKCPWSGLNKDLDDHLKVCTINEIESKENILERVSKYEEINHVKVNTSISLRERLKLKGINFSSSNKAKINKKDENDKNILSSDKAELITEIDLIEEFLI